MALIKGIHHVSMKTRDEQEYNKTVEFYRDILGLSVARTWEFGIMFDSGNGLIEIFKNAEDELGKGVIRHVAFAVDDVDEDDDDAKAIATEWDANGALSDLD